MPTEIKFRLDDDTQVEALLSCLATFHAVIIAQLTIPEDKNISQMTVWAKEAHRAIQVLSNHSNLQWRELALKGYALLLNNIATQYNGLIDHRMQYAEMTKVVSRMFTDKDRLEDLNTGFVPIFSLFQSVPQKTKREYYGRTILSPFQVATMALYRNLTTPEEGVSLPQVGTRLEKEGSPYNSYIDGLEKIAMGLLEDKAEYKSLQKYFVQAPPKN